MLCSPRKQRVRGYQLHKTSLMVWLGNSEKTEVRRPPLLSLVEDVVSQPPQKSLRAKGTQPTDCPLIGDAILLFDAALDQFDKDEDHRIRHIIDHLALDVLNRIRECTQNLASAHARAVSK